MNNGKNVVVVKFDDIIENELNIDQSWRAFAIVQQIYRRPEDDGRIFSYVDIDGDSCYLSKKIGVVFRDFQSAKNLLSLMDDPALVSIMSISRHVDNSADYVSRPVLDLMLPDFECALVHDSDVVRMSLSKKILAGGGKVGFL